jgi:hypothetical protein
MENVNLLGHKICSNCFNDEGLRLNSLMFGEITNSQCINCGSTEGYKLTEGAARQLADVFFVQGTLTKLKYGGFPEIQFNDYHYQKSDIEVPEWLKGDIKLLEEAGKIGFFYYGPRLWMVGEVEPLKSLQKKHKRPKIIDQILTSYPTREISNIDYFYRIRANPVVPDSIDQYDSPPIEHLGKGRFDTVDFPILYGSQDLEVCLHECRVTVEDNIYLSKLRPSKTLKLLDLTHYLVEPGVTEFESLDMAIYFLFLAGKHSYEICHDIAVQAHKKGYDGLIYPSYFSYVRTGARPFDTAFGISIRRFEEMHKRVASETIPNLALFGRPLEEGNVTLECINRVTLNRVQYHITLGPAKV